jgi:flagella basal body P-ring formation protein FlgA
MARVFLIIIMLLGLWAAPNAAIAADAEQVTANRALQRGALIRKGDVTGPYAVEDYVGQELIRSVRAGTVMTPRHVRTPLQVERNETVTLVFRRGPLTMETIGRSLDEGSVGDRISVLNTTSRKRITGRIIGPGLVEVTP